MKTKLWFILPMFGLIFAACQKDELIVNDDNLKNRVIATLNEPGCLIDDGETPLIAGQTDTVGLVTVEFVGDDIVVTYTTDEGWFITETHLHIAASEEDLRAQVTNRGGNPQIGNFDYGDDDLYTDEVTYTIPKGDIDPEPSDGCYYIAAHAVVVGPGEGEGGVVDLDAFNAMFPEDGLLVDVNLGGGPAPGNRSYYDDITISGGSFLDGTYDAWCIEGTVLSVYIASPTAFSTYGFLPEGIVSIPENFDKVNWLLNNVYAGMDDGEFVYTWGDLQIAIYWLLDDNEPRWLEYLYLDGYNTEEPWEEQDWWNKAKKLYDMALDLGEGFVPGCGERIGIALDYGDKQNILISYPLPCEPEEREETAWGQGCLFTPRGSWAMFFKVCE